MEIEEILKDRDFAAQEIMRLLDDAAKKEALANKIGQSYTDMYSEYKVGDKLIIKPYPWNLEKFVVVKKVSFDRNSTLPAFARLHCAPASKNWKEIKDRGYIFISEGSKILSKQ